MLLWFSALYTLAGVLASREAGRVLSVHCVHTTCFATSPRHQPARQVLKTICRNIRSSTPEDDRNDA